MRVCIKSHVFILYVYAHLNVYDAFVSARVCVHVYDYAYANAKDMILCIKIYVLYVIYFDIVLESLVADMSNGSLINKAMWLPSLGPWTAGACSSWRSAGVGRSFGAWQGC